MTDEETATLTRCMVESGAILDWNSILPTNLVDKHSTGGVGDKISMILAPLVACLGVSVPMMAGRGLGHTGGTIDKLESIPGYQTGLSIPDFQRIVSEVGCSIVAASKDMCLADKKLYALRDVTATVSSVPLQTASILCKKIAEHPRSLVLDVKYGKASFQSSIDEAIKLATSMIATSEANGLKPTTCLLTHMDSIIGTTVGNWLEIVECLDLLKDGTGSPDLVALVVIESAQMLQQSEKYADQSLESLMELCLNTLQSGKAYEKFEEMVKAHGGDISVCRDPSTHPDKANLTSEVKATQSGYIAELDGMLIGNVSVMLGAGRHITDEPVDTMAGLTLLRRDGDKVSEGDVIARLYTNRSQEVMDRACRTLQDSIIYSESPIQIPFVVSNIVTSTDGIQHFTMPQCLATLYHST